MYVVANPTAGVKCLLMPFLIESTDNEGERRNDEKNKSNKRRTKKHWELR
jgi:hypothetical protein